MRHLGNQMFTSQGHVRLVGRVVSDERWAENERQPQERLVLIQHPLSTRNPAVGLSNEQLHNLWIEDALAAAGRLGYRRLELDALRNKLRAAQFSAIEKITESAAILKARDGSEVRISR
jgi:hypothetical protein